MRFLGNLIPPRLTSAERDALTNIPEASIIYNTTTNRLETYNSSNWDGAGSQESIIGEVFPVQSFNFGDKSKTYAEAKGSYTRVAILTIFSSPTQQATSIYASIYGENNSATPVSILITNGLNTIVEKTGINSTDSLNLVNLGALSNLPTGTSIWEVYIASDDNKKKVRLNSLSIS